MKNKILKISSCVLLIMLVLLMAMPRNIYAKDYLDPDSVTVDDPSGVAENFKTTAGKILAVVQIIGVSIAIIMLVVLAIKYISAAPNDKAEIKKHAVVYVIGAVVLFGSSFILEIIKNFATNI